MSLMDKLEKLGEHERQKFESQVWLIERLEEVCSRLKQGQPVSESELAGLNARIERSKRKDGWLTRTLVGLMVGCGRISSLFRRAAR